MMASVAEVEVVVAHNERATLRVGDVFAKIDADQARTAVEVEAMAMAPVPTPQILWRKPPVLALAALPGTALGHLGQPSTASPAAWAAAGAAIRTLHDAPLPPWPGRSPGELASRLDGECEWLVASGVLPAGLVARNRQLAETALRPWTPVFIHGDLQVDHVFVDGSEVTGIVDWSEASQGDALFDLAILTLGHQEHLGDVLAGYGTDVDRDLIRAWWSLRCLTNVRWLAEHGAAIPAVRRHERGSAARRIHPMSAGVRFRVASATCPRDLLLEDSGKNRSGSADRQAAGVCRFCSTSCVTRHLLDGPPAREELRGWVSPDHANRVIADRDPALTDLSGARLGTRWRSAPTGFHPARPRGRNKSGPSSRLMAASITRTR
jgi:aminoglycoside phosphotransferase (APT) family kinase protein